MVFVIVHLIVLKVSIRMVVIARNLALLLASNVLQTIPLRLASLSSAIVVLLLRQTV